MNEGALIFLFTLFVWGIVYTVTHKRDLRFAKWPGGQCPECKIQSQLTSTPIECNH